MASTFSFELNSGFDRFSVIQNLEVEMGFSSWWSKIVISDFQGYTLVGGGSLILSSNNFAAYLGPALLVDHLGDDLGALFILSRPNFFNGKFTLWSHGGWDIAMSSDLILQECPFTPRHFVSYSESYHFDTAFIDFTEWIAFNIWDEQETPSLGILAGIDIEKYSVGRWGITWTGYKMGLIITNLPLEVQIEYQLLFEDGPDYYGPAPRLTLIGSFVF
jgi:hypothetical protein